MSDFVASMKLADSAALRAMIPEIDVTCPVKNQLAARRNLGKLHALEAQARLDAGEPAPAVRNDLARYQQFGDHWQLQEIRGVLASRADEHQAAAEHFLRSLDLIEDENFTPKAPEAKVITAIHERATEALSLASELVTMSTRSGDTRAYYRNSLRGVKIPKKNPQITFVYDQVDFDAKGQRAASELLKILRKESAGQITIIGHTDERGTDDYNLNLSKGRALAIQDYLRRNDIPDAVRVWWCGERVPAKINNAARYDQEEIWRISRRVEVFYDPSGVASERYASCLR